MGFGSLGYTCPAADGVLWGRGKREGGIRQEKLMMLGVNKMEDAK